MPDLKPSPKQNEIVRIEKCIGLAHRGGLQMAYATDSFASVLAKSMEDGVIDTAILMRTFNCFAVNATIESQISLEAVINSHCDQTLSSLRDTIRASSI